MRTQLIRTLACGGLGMLLLIPAPAQDKPMTIRKGKSACHVLQFPRPWTPPPNERYDFLADDKLEFRRPAGSSESSIVMIAKRGPSFNPVLSYQKYLVDLTGKRQLTLITRREWDSGTPAPTSQAGIPAEELGLTYRNSGPGREKPIVYRGHQYPPKSLFWAAIDSEATRLSTAGTWLSVHSFEPLRASRVLWNGNYGEFYIDVYNAESGELKVEVFGHYDYFGELDNFQGVQFIGDRFLFVLTDHKRGMKALVCDMEAAK